MRPLLAAFMLLFASPVLGQGIAEQAVLEGAVNRFIRPGMVQFEAAAGGLEAAMGALCADPSSDALKLAQRRFGETALAYGQIELIRIGPLMEDNRAERLLFFPDRKGIGLRQVQAILADEDASATRVTDLAGKSVAVQGLSALEFVLFGTGFEALGGAEGEFRCRYGQAIAGNIAAIAGELVLGWAQDDGVAGHLLHPAPEFSDYRTPVEALEEIVGLISHGVEAVRDVKLKPFMAGADSPARPRQALFWRSGLTMAMVGANIEGLRRLVDVSGVARAVGPQHQGLDNTIAFEFRNAARALDLVRSPVEGAVADGAQVRALDYLVLVTGSLQAIVGEQLSAALGLSVGFSSLDGD